MIRGFLYQRGTQQRIPYFVTEMQAAEIAARHNGTTAAFSMALPGYGVMTPATWEFRPATSAELAGREQWNTSSSTAPAPQDGGMAALFAACGM